MFAKAILATVRGHCSVPAGESQRIMQKMQKCPNRLLLGVWEEGWFACFAWRWWNTFQSISNWERCWNLSAMNIFKSAGSPALAQWAAELSGPLMLSVNSSRSVNVQLVKTLLMRREEKGINEPAEERAARGQSKGGAFSILSIVRTVKGIMESSCPNELEPPSFPGSFNPWGTEPWLGSHSEQSFLLGKKRWLLGWLQTFCWCWVSNEKG